MSKLLESYAAGRWHTAPDEGTPLLSAVDGSEVARISATGLDLGEMVTYAREVGGPALAKLTFHERAAALKALALTLMAGKEEFYALSTSTGATKRDSGVDIDGGFGILSATRARPGGNCPTTPSTSTARSSSLGKKGTFLGQHVYTSRRGVAVQINAFNFPVWGFLEKLAPAFIAGVPSIVKPASQSAYLTDACSVASSSPGCCPRVRCSCCRGSAGDLLDHLGGQDSVAFTGSADTAAQLRAHPNVVGEGGALQRRGRLAQRSILGPDVAPGSAEFDLYVKQLVTEMTVKAGQKCTAIRRAFVPPPDGRRHRRGRGPAVAVVVGDPAAEASRWAPSPASNSATRS